MEIKENHMKKLYAIGWAICLFVITQGTAMGGFDLNTLEDMAKAQVSIERLRKQTPTDWKKIKVKYDILAPLVIETDKNKGLEYDKESRAAMAACEAGEKVKVNQQVLAKGLQHVVVLNIHDALDQLGQSDTAGKQVSAMFEGIRPTFTRRDKDFYDSVPTLEKEADRSLAQISKAGTQVPWTAKKELRDIIDRTYGLCVLYEIIKVEKLRDSNPASCEVKVKEAEIFYRIIQPRIQKHNPAAHDVVNNMLAAGFDQMAAATIEAHLNQGLAGITLK